MVVESGEVVTNPEGQPEGTYIKLVLANAEESVLYINVTDLIEYVTAGEDTATIHVMISDDHKVTANVIAGSIGTTELAASVVASLGKADSALQASDIVTGSENGTISVDGTDVAVKGLDSAAYAKLLTSMLLELLLLLKVKAEMLQVLKQFMVLKLMLIA